MNASVFSRKNHLRLFSFAAWTFGLAVVLGSLSGVPAFAEDWHGDGDHRGGYGRYYDRGEEHRHGEREWWEHERREREEWEHEHRYYAPPVIGYPPPQAFYAPPPVVLGAPAGLNIILPIHIR